MKTIFLVFAVGLGLADSRWLRQHRSNQPSDTSFVGLATNDLSTSILQGYIDDDKNIAFSPLGYSAILAILAEGATGETRNQLVKSLHLPEDQQLTRKTYRYILERLKFRNEYKDNQPELKNFFYIYKNYTINDDYKKILEDYYLTDVKSVERYSIQINSDDDDEDEKKEEEKNTDIENLPPPKESNEKLISYAIEDKPEKVDISHPEIKPPKNIKEKIKYANSEDYLKDETVGDEETMVAVEARHNVRDYKVLMKKDDITSSMSVNSVGGKSSKSTNALMLIFNGMYFRGSWLKPFDLVEPGLFYKSNTEKKQVQMMKARGIYKTTALPEMDSEAILLPYNGGRYALLVILPRARDGLLRLTADLSAISLPEIQERLQDELLQVALPTFYVDTTTKPLSALAKFGVSSIFGREAELSGISSTEGLFVQELVQNVAVRVDNAVSSAIQMSGSNVVEELGSLKNLPLNNDTEGRKFTVDRPFLFYILDHLDNVVVAAGKITDPQAPEN